MERKKLAIRILKLCRDTHDIKNPSLLNHPEFNKDIPHDVKYCWSMLVHAGCFLCEYDPQHFDYPTFSYLSWKGHDLLEELEAGFQGGQ